MMAVASDLEHTGHSVYSFAHDQRRSPLHQHPATSIDGEIKPNKPRNIPPVGSSNQDIHSYTAWKPTTFLERVVDTAGWPVPSVETRVPSSHTPVIPKLS